MIQRFNKNAYFIVFLLLSSIVDANDYIHGNLEINGLSRNYVYKFPDNTQKTDKLPVLIALHGGGSNWEKFNRGTTKYTLEKAANNYYHVLLIYPEGINNHWNDGHDVNNLTDDVAFISALIDRSINQYQANTNQVFVAGMSNGGFMVIRLAQELSRKVNSVAAVAAQMGVNNKSIEMVEPISFLLINGLQDPIVPYYGGEMKPFKFANSRGLILSTQQTIDTFVKHNQCNAVPQIKVKNTRKFDQTTVITKTYVNCTKQSKVKLLEIKGGGHTWPGGKQYFPKGIIGNLSREINASDTMVEFFLNVN